MDRKDKIVNLLEQGWDMEQQFLNEQPPEEREHPGTFEHWQRKDVAVHIETWIGRLADNIRAVRCGETPHRWEDFNAENKVIFENHQSKTWQEAFDFARQNHQKLVDVVEELGPEGLENPEVLPWSAGQPIWRNIVGNGYTHALLHIGEHYRDLGDKTRYADMVEKLATSTIDLDDSPAWQGTVIYNLACSHALTGQTDKALQELGEALRLNPGLREWSQQDADLEPLRGEAGYEELYK